MLQAPARGYNVTMEPWIAFTLLAVTGQSIRTAGQKRIARSLSIEATTLVRFLFGLPFAVLYMLSIKLGSSQEFPRLDLEFAVPAALAAVSQVFATFCLVKAITLKNFAVGTALAKTEAILTAVIGALFFGAALSGMAYVAVVVGVVGVLVASNWQVSLADLHHNASIKYGVGAGLGFALASLWLRQSSLSLETSSLFSAALVLCFMVALQTAICLVWIALQDRGQLRLVYQNLPASTFIGFTSVLGSVGWFTAMSLQEAALVKTLGQVEFVITVLITYLYFKERINFREYIGIALVVVSIILLLKGA